MTGIFLFFCSILYVVCDMKVVGVGIELSSTSTLKHPTSHSQWAFLEYSVSKFGPFAFKSVVPVIILLRNELVVCKVDGKSSNGDSETWKSGLETIKAAELALISPGVSLSPRVRTHGECWCLRILMNEKLRTVYWWRSRAWSARE